MVGIADIRRQTQQWLEEGKLPTGGGGERLFLNADDIVFFYFLSKGDDNDPFFELYMAHEYPPTTPGAFRTLRTCPVLSEFDQNYPCAGCRADIKAKPQMAMWLLISDILRATKKDDQQFPSVAWEGRTMWHEKVEGLKLWDTSAWRDSPLNDIMMLREVFHGDLHAARMQLRVTGSGLSRRYKIFAEPNSPHLPADEYSRFAAQAKPVRQLLMERLNAVATVAASDAPQFQPAPPQHSEAPQMPFTPVFDGPKPQLVPEASAAPAAAPAAPPRPPAAAPIAPPAGARSLF